MRTDHFARANHAADLVRQVHAKYADDPLVAEMHTALWAAAKPVAKMMMTPGEVVALGGGTPKTEDPPA